MSDLTNTGRSPGLVWLNNGGYKSIVLPHGMKETYLLVLSGNQLTNLVLPAGLIDLNMLWLNNNLGLTNVIIQMDTSIKRADRPDRSLSIRLKNVPLVFMHILSWMKYKFLITEIGHDIPGPRDGQKK